MKSVLTSLTAGAAVLIAAFFLINFAGQTLTLSETAQKGGSPKNKENSPDARKNKRKPPSKNFVADSNVNDKNSLTNTETTVGSEPQTSNYTATEEIQNIIPAALGPEVNSLWRKMLTSPSVGCVWAQAPYVIVSDKSKDKTRDIWRCLDSGTGHEVWNISYDAPGDMEYTNAPRTPAVKHGDMVYLLGAFGDLHCVDLTSRQIVWRCNLTEKFGGEVPRWGFCAKPLIADGKVIVKTAAKDAALAALDCKTGETLWKCPGHDPGYGNLIVGTFGGKRQIVGHDLKTLGGWDIETGRRLWTHKPLADENHNVPAPVQVGEYLLAASQNNGARLYEFADDGTIIQQPIAVNIDFAPEITTPVFIDGVIWGISKNGLMCLDPAEGLKEIWTAKEEPFTDYAAFIPGDGRLLAVLKNAAMTVLPSRPQKDFVPQTTPLFDFKTEIWSKPAMISNKLFLRSERAAVCILLKAGD